jgi:PAS domain S-box-containing protein
MYLTDLSGIIGVLRDPMLLVTGGGTILAANAPAEELFGRAPHTLIGAQLGALLAGENGGATQSLRMSRGTSETIPTSLQVRRPDGQILPCSTVGASVCLEGADDSIIWLRLLPQESPPKAFAVFDQRSYHLSKRESVRAERTEVADELRQSEQLLRLLVENIEGYAIFTLDVDGRVTSWNSGAERMNGYPSEEVLGRHFSILYRPEDVERGAPDAQLRGALAALRAEDEGWRVRKDGSRFWARAALTAMRSRDGKVIGLANITRDLTERKGNQGALREAEARTRLILDTALDAVMTMDEHGVITEWNVQAESMFGWRREEATGRLLAELVIPRRYRDAHAKGLRDFLAMGAGPILNRRVEIAAVSRDGCEFPVELSVAPYRIGEAWFFSGFVRDITQRKQAEEALRASELRWRTMFEKFPVGIVLSDANGRYISANPAFQEMVGYSDLELMHLGPLDITHEDDLPASTRMLDEIHAGHRQSFEMEKRYRRKDGTSVWAMLSILRVPESGQTPALYPTIVVDITKRKQAEEALRESELELARVSRLTTMCELTASIAHELRQPLSAAVSHGTTCQHWLSEDTLDLGRARRAAQRMMEAAQRASDVMDRIRGLLNKAPPEKVDIAINDLLRETLAVIETELRARQIVVAADLAEPLPSVVGDRVQLQQVVLNLIMNGVEAMSGVTNRLRQLRISSRRDAPDSILVAIEDSGTGLDPSILERMFNPFFTTKAGGMGMGLSICRSIIASHGGRLWASLAQSHGALMQFTLPIGDNLP